MEKIIFHIDVNSAFLSWEAVHRMKVLEAKDDLRVVPSAVGGDVNKRHGIILAKSLPAKKYGIRTGETVHEALKKCPELLLVPPNFDLYEKSSKRMIEILKEYTPFVEQFSIDEAFCDMTGTAGLYGYPVVAANLIKGRIREELGFTVNIGISHNKLLAKMASDFQKPDMVHTLFPDEIKEKMWILPVEELFYVGRATKKKLHTLGIHTIGELANTDVHVLRAHLKSHGDVIHSFANGIDFSVIESEGTNNKGYGNSTTTSFDIDHMDSARKVLLSLAETVGARLRNDNVRAGVIAIHLVDFKFYRFSHQTTLLTATNTTNIIYKEACGLLEEVWDGTPLRNIGIQTSKITKDEGMIQSNLFDCNRNEKLSKLDIAIDTVREKFGDDSIIRASFMHHQK